MFKKVNNQNNSAQQVNLTDCIGSAFYGMYWDIIKGKHTYYNLTGGRGSLKSSFISIMIILIIMMCPEMHAVIYRKVADTIETSTYAQICWAIEKLGVSHKFKCTKSPYRVTYLPTGQQIIFKGLDKAEKSKSIKVKFGYIGILWFEELDEYSGEEEIRKVQQSVIRGGSNFIVFKSMNPPKSKMCWANLYINQEKFNPQTMTLHTTYLQAIAEWLGQQFIDDAEWLKSLNPRAYEYEYLGIPIGYGSEVFDNLEERVITDEEIAHFDRIYMGVDWGWYPDPYHWGKMHYDANHRILYIFDEYRTNKSTNSETAEYLKVYKGVTRSDTITCDSAEEKSVSDYRAFGLNARPADKGPGSVKMGMKWLQGLTKIVIDPQRCPKTWEEFSKYQYELTKDGTPTGNFPDKDNHSIDMVRYALERVWTRRGN